MSFLSGGDSQGHTPQSGEIIGILKQLKDEMTDQSDAQYAPESGEIIGFLKQLKDEMTDQSNAHKEEEDRYVDRAARSEGGGGCLCDPNNRNQVDLPR